MSKFIQNKKERKRRALTSLKNYNQNQKLTNKCDIGKINSYDTCDKNSNIKRFKTHCEFPTQNEPRYMNSTGGSISNKQPTTSKIGIASSMVEINSNKNSKQSNYQISTSYFRSIKNQPTNKTKNKKLPKQTKNLQTFEIPKSFGLNPTLAIPHNPIKLSRSQSNINNSDVKNSFIFQQNENYELKLRNEKFEQDAKLQINSMNSNDSSQFIISELKKEIDELKIKLQDRDDAAISKENSTTGIEKILNDKEDRINRLYSVQNQSKSKVEQLQNEISQLDIKYFQKNNESETKRLESVQNDYEELTKHVQSNGFDNALLKKDLKHSQNKLKKVSNEKKSLEQKLKSYEWILTPEVADKIQLLFAELNNCTDELAERIKVSIDIDQNGSIDLENLLIPKRKPINLISNLASDISKTAAIINKEFLDSKLKEIEAIRHKLNVVRLKNVDDYSERIASNQYF